VKFKIKNLLIENLVIKEILLNRKFINITSLTVNLSNEE